MIIAAVSIPPNTFYNSVSLIIWVQFGAILYLAIILSFSKPNDSQLNRLKDAVMSVFTASNIT